MSISFVDVISFLKYLIGDSDKLNKFKEVIADVKELINDLKEVISMVKN